MANFGFSRLTVVAPFAPHWREARSAVGAPDLLQNAKTTECLAEAVADCTLVIGTGTRTYRKPEQPVVSLPDLAPLVQWQLERDGKIAAVFGPEKHGLTRDDLALCHIMVEIPTDPRQPSMNLGQAVAVCLYELTRSKQPDQGSAGEIPAEAQAPIATIRSRTADSGHLDILAEMVGQTMAAAGYTPRSMQAANRHDLSVLLRRLSLSERDAKRILGLFRRILWRLNRNPQPNENLK
jgi:tRNA/rRNA methyltransferase